MIFFLIIRPVKFLRKVRFIRTKNSESSLWGYAASLRILDYASKYDSQYIIHLQKVLLYVLNNLQSSSGRHFLYKPKGKIFIRHEAHMFQSLIQILRGNNYDK